MIRAGSRKRSKRPTLRSSAGDTTVRMAREFSAGGVLVRKLRGRWVVAAIRPGGVGVLKAVSFFLVRYTGGRLGDAPDDLRHEVAEVRWLPLEEAPRLLA